MFNIAKYFVKFFLIFGNISETGIITHNKIIDNIMIFWLRNYFGL